MKVSKHEYHIYYRRNYGNGTGYLPGARVANRNLSKENYKRENKVFFVLCAVCGIVGHDVPGDFYKHKNISKCDRRLRSGGGTGIYEKRTFNSCGRCSDSRIYRTDDWFLNKENRKRKRNEISISNCIIGFRICNAH